MKPVLLALVLTAGSLPADASDTIAVPLQPYRMFPQDWDAWQGRYQLSNGQQMLLHRRGLRMYAEITGRPRAQLVAAAANVFVAVDGKLKMTLTDEGNDRITGAVELRRSAQQRAMAAERVGH